MEYLRILATSIPQSMLGGVQTLFQNTSAHIGNEINGLSIFTISFFSLAVASTFWLFFSSKKSESRLPPGDFGFPLIGDTFKFLAAHHNFATIKWFQQKREKYGPIFKASILGNKHVFLDAPDGFKLVFNPPDANLIGPTMRDSMARLFGPDLVRMLQSTEQPRTLRKYWIENFLGVDVVLEFLPNIEQKALDHIYEFWLAKGDGAEVKAHKSLQFFTLSVIGDLIVGIKDWSTMQKLLPLFWTYSDGMFGMTVNIPGFQFHRSMKARTQIHEILQENITKRRQELRQGIATPRQDFLSINLTHPNEHGHFHTDAEIRDSMLSLMWAGFENVASTITMILRNIGKNPEVYQKLIYEHANIAANKSEGEPLSRQDLRSMKYTWAVAQESMRLTPPNPDIHREAAEDVQYKGFTIPKGYKLTCCAPQGMWNPDLYPNPDRFDPTRFLQSAGTKSPPPFTFTPFGGGSWMCTGIELAKLTMLTFLHHFLKNIKWSLADPEERLLYNILVYPENGLPVRIEKCKLY